MGSQVSAWENHGETASMEHSGKKAGLGRAGGQRAGQALAGGRALVKPWPGLTAGQSWLRDLVEDSSPDNCRVG